MTRRIATSSTTRKGIALAIGAVCACAVGVLLAVGRGGDDTGLQTAASAGAARATGVGAQSPGNGDPFAQLRSCLEGHGVTPPERGTRPTGPSDELRTALEACRQYLPRPPFGDDDRGFGPPPRSDGRDGDGADGTF
jgi:hypothetical protein